jgi:hypothetical protein
MLQTQQKPQFSQKLMGGKTGMIEAFERYKPTRLAMHSTKYPPKLPLAYQPQ